MDNSLSCSLMNIFPPLYTSMLCLSASLSSIERKRKRKRKKLFEGERPFLAPIYNLIQCNAFQGPLFLFKLYKTTAKSGYNNNNNNIGGPSFKLGRKCFRCDSCPLYYWTVVLVKLCNHYHHFCFLFHRSAQEN